MALALRRACLCGARSAWPALPASQTAAAGELRQSWLGMAGGMRNFSAAPSVPASLVKELRTRTGASMGKCRQALAEEAGDVDKAVDWLRKRGIRSMERRTNEAGESLLAICTAAGAEAGAIVEIKAETDFVIQNKLCQQISLAVACTAAARGTSVESAAGLGEAALTSCPAEVTVSAGSSVEAALLEMGSVLGERLVLGQSQQIRAAPGGVVAGYAHPKSAGAMPGTGRMASLVSLRPSPAGAEVPDGVSRAAAQLARHIVALQPRFVSNESVDVDVLAKERDMMREAYMGDLDEKRKANLTEEVLTKILDGKTQKFLQESVLLRQELTVPGAGDADAKPPTVEKWLQSEAKTLGLEAIHIDEFRLVML